MEVCAVGRPAYANPVGRTIFQKICYVVSEIGVVRAFTFDREAMGRR